MRVGDRPCACGCGLRLPADAPRRRKYAEPACRLRAFKRTHARRWEKGRTVYDGTELSRLRARVAVLEGILVGAGLPPPEEER